MALKCVLGFHAWSGCKCSACGAVRDAGHDWSRNCETCSGCDQMRDRQHDWSQDCEQCLICGINRNEAHDWSVDCTQCAKCSRTRTGSHAWNGCKCSQCATRRDEGHDWSRDCRRCSRCGKTRDVQHDWAHDCEKCSMCEETRDGQHDWSQDCERCATCGKTRNQHHDWKTDCTTCSLCGKASSVGHKFRACRCTFCKQERHEWRTDCHVCRKCGETGKTTLESRSNVGVGPRDFGRSEREPVIGALKCECCGAVYTIGTDAVAVCLEFTASLSRSVVLASSDPATEREDLVARIDESNKAALERAMPSWKIIHESLLRGQERTWKCGECQGVNSYRQGSTKGPSSSVPAQTTIQTLCAEGVRRLELKDYPGAIWQFTKAIELDPRCASAYLGRAVAKDAMGDRSGYDRDFEMAARLDPEGLSKAMRG